MRTLRRLLMVAGALLLAACLPVSSSIPLGTTVGLSADKALLGSWIDREKDKERGVEYVTYYYFLPVNETTISVVAVMLADKEGRNGGWEHYRLSTATLGPHRYMNVVRTSKSGGTMDDHETGFIPMLYRLDGDSILTLYLLDEDKIKEAIKAGLIAGVVPEEKDDSKDTDIRLTATGPALDAFFAKPDADKYFKVYAVLKKAP
jgi:hypothetical protein